MKPLKTVWRLPAQLQGSKLTATWNPPYRQLQIMTLHTSPGYHCPVVIIGIILPFSIILFNRWYFTSIKTSLTNRWYWIKSFRIHHIVKRYLENYSCTLTANPPSLSRSYSVQSVSYINMHSCTPSAKYCVCLCQIWDIFVCECWNIEIWRMVTITVLCSEESCFTLSALSLKHVNCST